MSRSWGADRSGLELAARLGHTITRLHPGLVPLESPDEHVRQMQGVKVVARVRAVLSPRRTIADTDDLLFTPYGTALGVLTLLVLMRPSVKVLFGRAP